MSVLVTGGAGFIGSALVRALIRDGERVVTVDKLTYAGSRLNLAEADRANTHSFVQADIADAAAMAAVFREHRPRLVMHLAAESHVDRSITGSDAFVRTNIVGTHALLEAAHAYYATLSDEALEAE